MKIYIAIDDTDNLDEGATGETANYLIQFIEKKGWAKCDPVTRHQLLLHPDIPYTSHNSAMCFVANTEECNLEELCRKMAVLLKEESVSGSDPGLCILVEETLADEEKSKLINYGYEAKQRVMTKTEAYDLARVLKIHLSEHGGTGEGIIGALAAAGLRMTGNDGRFQGRLKFKLPGEKSSAGEIIANTPVEQVRSVDGEVLPEEEMIYLGEKLKTVYLDGKQIMLVYRQNEEQAWKTCTNSHLERY